MAADNAPSTPPAADAPPIRVDDLTMAFGDFVVQKDISFTVNAGEIFVIMGGSGCGKSTLLNHLIGLIRPAAGTVRLYGESLWDATDEEQRRMLRQTGVLFQSGALWSSMTLAENIALPLREYTDLSEAAMYELAKYKLALVGLAGFEDYYPSEISGGMQKRAGLARAMALDPRILFFDEPSSGLDPVSAAKQDALIKELRDALGTTLVIVSHDLASIFNIADNSILLDASAKTMIAQGAPKRILAESKDPKVIEFLTREGTQRE